MLCCFLVLKLLLSSPSVAAATAPRPLLQPLDAVHDISPYSAYLIDASRTLTLDDILSRDHLFKPIPGKEPGFGYRADAIWLRIGITVPSDARPSWRLLLPQAYLQEVDAYVLADTGARQFLMSLDESSAFDARPIAYRHLAAPVELRPGGEYTIYVRYRSSGFTGLKVLLASEVAFTRLALNDTAKSFAFQGMFALLIAAGLSTFLFARSRAALAYAFYLTSCALFLLNRDGLGFQYLWPDAPGFNARASLVLGAAMVIGAALYARAFLRTATLHPRFNTLLMALAGLALLLVAASEVLTQSQAKQTMVLLACVSTFVYLAAGLNAARTRAAEVRFYVFGWAGVVVSALIIAARHLLGIPMSGTLALDSMRLVIVFDALMMGLALVDRYIQLRARSRRMLEENLAAAQANIDLRERLDRLEERARQANDLAVTRERALADVSHDLRQPIHALRMNIKRLADVRDGTGPTDQADLRERIDAAFGYLEGVIDTQLESASDAAHESAATKVAAAVTQASTVLDNIREMFADEAGRKLLRFRVVPCSAVVRADALPLMRMLANVVSNAIKFTSSGGVLVGCRRRSAKLCFEVHDTGPGFEAGEFEALLERHARAPEHADATPGHGLGLAIVVSLAQQAGAALRCTSIPGRGTCVSIEVPLVARANSTRAAADTG